MGKSPLPARAKVSKTSKQKKKHPIKRQEIQQILKSKNGQSKSRSSSQSDEDSSESENDDLSEYVTNGVLEKQRQDMAKWAHRWPELFIQVQCGAYAKSKGVLMTSMPIGGPIRVNCWIISNDCYYMPGFPDAMIMFANGKIWFVEFKSAKGHLSPKQIAVLSRLKKLGYWVSVISSVDQFISEFDKLHKLSKSPSNAQRKDKRNRQSTKQVSIAKDSPQTIDLTGNHMETVNILPIDEAEQEEDCFLLPEEEAIAVLPKETEQEDDCLLLPELPRRRS